MARYDVFLVNVLADREKAELIVRRLRALKFKVRYDKKRAHTTPTPRDYRDLDNSQSALVLWSKESCDTDKSDSDWLHAMAHHARSKDGVLLQAGLDKAVPDEPFQDDKRYSLSGMGPRKLVNGYYDLIDELGRRDGRKDLREWLALKAGDKAGKDAWKAAHPTDPLSQVKRAAPAAKTDQPDATQAAPRQKAPPLVITPLPAPTPNEINVGRIMLSAVGIVIFGMLVMSAALKTSTGLPATAGAGVVVVEQCPPGQMPDYLLEEETRPPLEPGPIIDDTE